LQIAIDWRAIASNFLFIGSELRDLLHAIFTISVERFHFSVAQFLRNNELDVGRLLLEIFK
jgi:hypothetical protein